MDMIMIDDKRLTVTTYMNAAEAYCGFHTEDNVPRDGQKQLRTAQYSSLSHSSTSTNAETHRSTFSTA